MMGLIPMRMQSERAACIFKDAHTQWQDARALCSGSTRQERVQLRQQGLHCAARFVSCVFVASVSVKVAICKRHSSRAQLGAWQPARPAATLLPVQT